MALTYTLNHSRYVLPEALGIFQDVKNLLVAVNLTILNFSLNFSTDLHLFLGISVSHLVLKISKIFKKINKNFTYLDSMSYSLDYLSK